MKKFFLFFLEFICLINSASAQDTSKDSRMKWWCEARFGIVIYWGDYAVPAGNYKGIQIAHGGEWIMNRTKIPVAEYQQYAKQFNSVKFNAEDWVKMAREAGMKYIVITVKHHDSFAMFRLKVSKWNIVDSTSYGKDVLKQLAAACKKYNIKLNFYYSQAHDWNNLGGAVARKVSSEGRPNPDSTRIDAYSNKHKGHCDVAVLWWNTPTNVTDEAALKLQTLLKLHPNIITNNRIKRPNFQGDTKTPEQKIPKQEELDGEYGETCMTMIGTWDYKSWDNKWKSKESLLHNLIDITSKRGNYLLNFGPKADGTLLQQSVDLL